MQTELPHTKRFEPTELEQLKLNLCMLNTAVIVEQPETTFTLNADTRRKWTGLRATLEGLVISEDRNQAISQTGQRAFSFTGSPEKIAFIHERDADDPRLAHYWESASVTLSGHFGHLGNQMYAVSDAKIEVNFHKPPFFIQEARNDKLVLPNIVTINLLKPVQDSGLTSNKTISFAGLNDAKFAHEVSYLAIPYIITESEDFKGIRLLRGRGPVRTPPKADPGVIAKLELAHDFGMEMVRYGFPFMMQRLSSVATKYSR